MPCTISTLPFVSPCVFSVMTGAVQFDPGTIESQPPWTLQGDALPPQSQLGCHLISPESQNKNALDDPSPDAFCLDTYI